MALINAFRKRIAEIETEHGFGSDEAGIHDASEVGMQTLTSFDADERLWREEVEKQLSTLTLAVQAVSRGNALVVQAACRGNIAESAHNESVAELSKVMESQHILSSVVARLEALEATCFTQSQSLKKWQDVFERVVKLESEAAFAKPQEDTHLGSEAAFAKSQPEEVVQRLDAQVQNLLEEQRALAKEQQELGILIKRVLDRPQEKEKEVAPGTPTSTLASGQEEEVGQAAAKSGQDYEDMASALHNERMRHMKIKAHCKIMSLVDSYTLEESIWDMALLIGLPQMGGFLASVLVGALVILNSCMQFLVCCIINDTFTGRGISSDDAEAMKQWRSLYAHNLQDMDRFTLQPLVKGVCEAQAGMRFLTDAGALFEEITAYLPTKEWYEQQDPFVGPLLPHMERLGELLCIVSIMVWLMKVGGSIELLWRCALALYGIPTSEYTQVSTQDHSNTLVSVCPQRKFFYSLVLLLQVFMSLFLGFCGTLFMIDTIDLRDLILNCSALAFVMDIDELVVATFLPGQAMCFLHSLDPLPVPPMRRFSGISMRLVVTIISIILAVIWSVGRLREQEQILRDTRHEICGGNIDFVVARDAAGVLVASSAPVVQESNEYIFNAVEQLTREDAIHFFLHNPLGKNDLSAVATSVTGGDWSLQTLTWKDVSEVVTYWNHKCEDMLPVDTSSFGYAVHFLAILQEVVEESSIQTCQDVKHYCLHNDIQGIRTRSTCPVTCGCNDPASSLVLVGKNGCSHTCWNTQKYNASMWSSECKDLDVSAQYWTEYAQGMHTYMSSLPESWTGNYTQLSDDIRNQGCNLLYTGMTVLGRNWADPCVELEGLSLKPIAFACPVSCGCPMRFRDYCPPTCRDLRE